MTKRSTTLIAIGIAVFVVGAAMVLASLHTGGGTRTKANLTAAQGTPVVVSAGPIRAGTTGETLIESNQVRLERVPARMYSINDVTSLSQLQQQSLVRSVPAGTPIQTTDLSPSAGPLPAPKGDQSITISLNSAAAGLAGYLQPGENVDVWANVTRTSGTSSLPTPCVTLVASKVKVLDVSVEVPPYASNAASTARALPNSLTVLLAVTPAQAGSLVFYQQNEQLYLVGTNQTDLPATSTCFGLTHDGSVVPVS